MHADRKLLYQNWLDLFNLLTGHLFQDADSIVHWRYRVQAVLLQRFRSGPQIQGLSRWHSFGFMASADSLRFVNRMPFLFYVAVSGKGIHLCATFLKGRRNKEEPSEPPSNSTMPSAPLHIGQLSRVTHNTRYSECMQCEDEPGLNFGTWCRAPGNPPVSLCSFSPLSVMGSTARVSTRQPSVRSSAE